MFTENWSLHRTPGGTLYYHFIVTHPRFGNEVNLVEVKIDKILPSKPRKLFEDVNFFHTYTI